MTYNEACRRLFPKACAILVKLGVQWGLNDTAAKLRDRLMEDDGAFLDSVEVFLEFTRLVDGFVEIHNRRIYGDLVRCDNAESLKAGMDLFRSRMKRRGSSTVFSGIRDGSHIALLRTDEDSDLYWVVYSDRNELVTREIFTGAYRTLINIREGGAS